jgi:hypothetical protein
MRISPLLLALAIGSCGGERANGKPGPDAPVDGAASTPTPPADTPAPSGPRYQGSGTVLESEAHGPELCLGGVATSLPPQCSGIPLVGWDWDKVEGEQKAQKTTWGEYQVTGTYDGKVLTPTEPPGPAKYSESAIEIKSACPEPAGGWQRPDPKRANHDQLARANTAAQAQPDFAGLWIVDPNKPVGERQDMSQVILNVAFTGDLERHTKELRKHWGGALCVVQRARTEAELIKIQESLQPILTELGLVFLGSSGDVVAGVVRVDVVFADASQQAKLDEKFGAGVVLLTSRLRPVP